MRRNPRDGFRVSQVGAAVTTDAPGALGRTPLLNVIERSTHARKFLTGSVRGSVAFRAVNGLESGAERAGRRSRIRSTGSRMEDHIGDQIPG
jgi:hypothetical protein